MFNVFIDKTVRCAGRCDFVGLIQQSRDTYIYRRVVRKANSDMSRLSQGLPIFVVGKSIHSNIFQVLPCFPSYVRNGDKETKKYLVSQGK